MKSEHANLDFFLKCTQNTAVILNLHSGWYAFIKLVRWWKVQANTLRRIWTAKAMHLCILLCAQSQKHDGKESKTLPCSEPKRPAGSSIRATASRRHSDSSHHFSFSTSSLESHYFCTQKLPIWGPFLLRPRQYPDAHVVWWFTCRAAYPSVLYTTNVNNI